MTEFETTPDINVAELGFARVQQGTLDDRMAIAQVTYVKLSPSEVASWSWYLSEKFSQLDWHEYDKEPIPHSAIARFMQAQSFDLFDEFELWTPAYDHQHDGMIIGVIHGFNGDRHYLVVNHWSATTLTSLKEVQQAQNRQKHVALGARCFGWLVFAVAWVIYLPMFGELISGQSSDITGLRMILTTALVIFGGIFNLAMLGFGEEMKSYSGYVEHLAPSES